MIIWFDISNSPQVLLFDYLIKDLKNNGHNIIITSRPLANTINLLSQKNINHTIIGKHYGKSIIRKIIGFPIRVFQLYNFLKKFKIDLAVSQSSFHSPLVAKLLRVPSIYTNDNEYALGNYLGFLFAKKILIPSNFSLNKYFVNNNISDKIIRYPGIKEGIYLWNKKSLLFNNRNNILSKNELITTIYIRPEPQTAQYYTGKINFLDNLIQDLQYIYKVIILVRNPDQYIHYTLPKFYKSYTPYNPLNFDEIAIDCNLFIGAGGTMTRELALLGIPTISVYQDMLLEVDKLLIEKNLLIHDEHLTHKKVTTFLNRFNDYNKSSSELLASGKVAYSLFKNEILKFS